MPESERPEPLRGGTVPLQTYLDAQLAEVRRAVDKALASESGEAVPLRQHVEALIADQRVHLLAQIAARAEHTSAILEEQRRGMLVAESEREKAASALRLELARAIEEGDRNLREHVQAQVGQIREALLSSEKLDLSRHATDVERIEAVKREVQIQRVASDQAIAKAETANEKRFEAFDEIREQVTAQAAEFLRRDVAEAQYEEVRRSLNQLAEEYRRAIADINQRLGKIT